MDETLRPRHVVTPQEIEEARQTLRRAERERDQAQQAWGSQYGESAVTENTIQQFRYWIAEYDRQLREVEAGLFRYRLRGASLALAAWFQRTIAAVQNWFRIEPASWKSAAVLTSAFMTAPLAAFLVLLPIKPSVLLPLLGLGFLGLCWTAICLARPTARLRIADRRRQLDNELAAAREQARAVSANLVTLCEGLRLATEVWDRCRACDRATERLESLRKIVEDERYQLFQLKWRELRGVPFEEFLVRVFRALGYRVETTKASGDYGVDLVVCVAERRVAVQAKGYEDNVGVPAVQQVYAGMNTYRCQECVAITNAGFTDNAVKLARSVNCLLIDGRCIPELIAGLIFPDLTGSRDLPPEAGVLIAG